MRSRKARAAYRARIAESKAAIDAQAEALAPDMPSGPALVEAMRARHGVALDSDYAARLVLRAQVAQAEAEARDLEALAKPAPASPGPARVTWSESELRAKAARSRALSLTEELRVLEAGQ